VQRLYEEEKREGILPAPHTKGVSTASPMRIEDDLSARGVVQLLMARTEHAKWVAELDLMQIPPEIDKLRKERDHVEQAKKSEELRRLAELQEELRRGEIAPDEALEEAARTRVPFEEIEARYTSRLVTLHNIGELKIAEESNITPEEADHYLRELKQKTAE